VAVGAGVESVEPGETPVTVYLESLIRDQTGLRDCARCGGTHPSLEWKHFVHPIEVSETERYEAWASCPATGDPIMFAVEHLGD
jgi:hypothetical protein